MTDFLKDKVKYIKEPLRLRVHIGYVLIITFTLTAEPTSTLYWLGTASVGLGLLIRVWASGIVMKNEELAVEGPYSLCRHPLYVGNILIGVGFASINGQLWAGITLLVYLLLFYPFTIKKEDRRMGELFGEEFDQYKSEVPRLIPRLTPYETLEGWSFNQYFVENKDIVNEGLVVLFWCYTLYLFL